MTTPVALSPDVFVTGQIDPGSLPRLAEELGIRRVVCNRPDNEEPGQPTNNEIRQAAKAAGLEFLSAPVRGMPDPETVAQVAQFIDQEGPSLLFCRSGMRSTVVWALGQSANGAEAGSLRQAAFDAGYDISGLPL